MKKINAIIISLVFFLSTNIQANSLFQAPNPYSFGPEGRTVSDLRDFATPKQMVNILPNRPVVATDSEGNRVYYTPDGKMTLSVAKDGSMSFSLGGVSKAYNSDGESTGVTRTLKGSGLLQEVRNDDNEIISYRALNGDGKTAATYDKDKNLTATYVYTGQGAKLDYVQNEMTGGRTYYDEFERPMVDVDFDGFILVSYQYQDISYEYGEDGKTIVKNENKDKGLGLLVSKKNYELDMKAETTFSTTLYDLDGKIACVKNSEGLVVTEYRYKNDDKGNRILDYVLDNLTQNRTYYDAHGNADYTANDQGFIITRYYDGYTVNIAADGSYSQVTKLDIDGKELYTTFKKISYNDDGTIDEVLDEDDVVLEKYHYKKNENGDNIIDYVVNLSNSEYNGKTTYTWYDDEGRPEYVTSKEKRQTLADLADKNNDVVLKDYSWNNDVLIYTFDRTNNQTSWYNMNKELVYETLNERIITKNIYNNGQLIGKWDAQTKKITILINERSWLTVKSDIEPSTAYLVNVIANSTVIENKFKENNYDLENVNIGELLADKIKSNENKN